MRALFFQSRYQLFQTNHERLLTRPDAALGRANFDRRLRDARRIQALRLVLYVGLYFSTLTAGITFLLTRVGSFPRTYVALQALAGTFSTLSLAFVLGILACVRYLGLADIELYFYSAESRSR